MKEYIGNARMFLIIWQYLNNVIFHYEMDHKVRNILWNLGNPGKNDFLDLPEILDIWEV